MVDFLFYPIRDRNHTPRSLQFIPNDQWISFIYHDMLDISNVHRRNSYQDIIHLGCRACCFYNDHNATNSFFRNIRQHKLQTSIHIRECSRKNYQTLANSKNVEFPNEIKNITAVVYNGVYREWRKCNATDCYVHSSLNAFILADINSDLSLRYSL